MIDAKTSVGTRGSDSLLHSLSSGLWCPHQSLECPISFSPFLPFGTLENTAGNGGVFLLYIDIGGLTLALVRQNIWNKLVTVFVAQPVAWD